MAVLRIQDFSGIIPVTGDRSLPDNYATKSINTWLYASELRGIRPPDTIATLTAGTKKVMRIPKKTPGALGAAYPPTYVPPPSFLGDSVYKQFIDPDTDIVRGQLVNDQFDRWYFCSPTTGPVFNTYARMLAGSPDYVLGVPGPNTAAGTTDTIVAGAPTGGTSTELLTIAWVYTWVNEFGEESAPCLPAVLSGVKSDATVPLSNIKDPVTPSSPNPPAVFPNWSKKNVYRTITGASGQTTYYRVTQLNIGTTTYNDNMATLPNTVLAQNLRLESTRWAPPPNNIADPKNCLQGFVGMANGFLIGFCGNRLVMSEPYHFHAWPAEYEQSTEYPIIGLGAFGQTCVVCTQGFPATATGTHPGTVAFTKSTVMEPCLSRGSIVTSPNGVVWASPNGLIVASPGGMDNVTEKLITKEEWTRDYMPTLMRAARYQNGYLALRDWQDGTPKSAFFIDPTALKTALTEISEGSAAAASPPGDPVKTLAAVNFFNDVWSGNVFLMTTGGAMQLWDPVRLDSETSTPTINTQLMPVLWRSKEFQYQFEENFSVYAIYWDDARYSNVSWGTALQPTTEKVRFRVWVNRVLRYDQVVPRNGRQVRLPSGFKGDIWQFEILARAPVYSLHVASTAKELKAA